MIDLKKYDINKSIHEKETKLCCRMQRGFLADRVIMLWELMINYASINMLESLWKHEEPYVIPCFVGLKLLPFTMNVDD